MNRIQKIVLVVGGVLMVGLLIFLSIQSLQRVGKVGVNVVVVPKDSTITLDGQPIKAGRVYLTKGPHVFKATRESFADAVIEVHTDTLDTKKTLYLMPQPNSDAAIDYLNKNPDEQMERESAAGEEAITTQNTIGERFPIVKRLPYSTLAYRIDYALNEDNSHLSLTVTLTPAADPRDRPNDYKEEIKLSKQQAQSFINANGINSSNTTITYNPDPDKP